MGKSFLNPLFDKTIFSRKENIVSRRHEVNIFKGTDCKVIGLKLAGSSWLPFL